MNNISEILCEIILVGLALALMYLWRTQRIAYKTIEQQPILFGINAQGLKRFKSTQYALIIIISATFCLCFSFFQQNNQKKQSIITAYQQKIKANIDTSSIWIAPDIADLPKEYPQAKLITYGRELIARTADFLGPEGIVKPMSNGMNCQNCHLNAGTKPFGNNYAAVTATYPKFRARSGAQETIHKRINDCFQRSLNGEALDSTSREMKAIVAYINWLGTAIPKNHSPKGVGLTKLKFLDRAANPTQGQLVYTSKCASCHNLDGQGLPMPEGNNRRYPPLWGERSYNESAGLFRLSNLAGYVKSNMPFGANYQNPQLTDEEAWDVAAFINAQPHPKHQFLQQDFPNIAKKPFDHPFAPFKDTFPESQHKFGPFQAIIDFYKKK